MNPSDSGSTGWVIGGRYRVIGPIGTGGMAEVFRAHDEVLSRDVAVKVFRRVSASADTAAGVQRQRIELQTLARLAHPNLITLFDGSLGGDDGPAYLVLELIDGATLADAIGRDAVSGADVRAIGAQIASALAYVHAANMVHRDVKPANILLGTDATSGSETVRARLSDFGIVRLIGDDVAGGMTGTQFTLGTASYLAPEQARGSAVGPPADIYALGLVLLETLTRVRAFDGPPIEAAMARLNRDPEIPANLPEPWPHLLAAMTRRDPAQRPTAQQVVDSLGNGGSGTTAATTVFAPPVVASALPTAATTAIVPEPLGPPPGPVRRAPVSETRAIPPVVVPPGRPREAADDGRRKGLPTLFWLALAAVAVVLIGVLIVVLAGNGSDGTPTPSNSATPSSSTARSSKSSSDSSSASSESRQSSPQTRSKTKSKSKSTSTSTSQSAPGTTASSSSSASQPSTPAGPGAGNGPGNGPGKSKSKSKNKGPGNAVKPQQP